MICMGGGGWGGGVGWGGWGWGGWGWGVGGGGGGGGGVGGGGGGGGGGGIIPRSCVVIFLMGIPIIRLDGIFILKQPLRPCFNIL